MCQEERPSPGNHVAVVAEVAPGPTDATEISGDGPLYLSAPPKDASRALNFLGRAAGASKREAACRVPDQRADLAQTRGSSAAFAVGGSGVAEVSCW